MCPSSDFAEMKTSVMIGDSPSLHTLQSRMPQYINHSSTPTMKQESQPLHLSTLLQSSLSLTPVRTLTMHCTKIFLLSGLLSIVQANDIIFYPNPACSQGNFNGCFGIGANTCCFGSGTDTFAISISKGSNDFATMFNGGGCTNPVCSAGAAGTFCCISNGLTGGRWTSLLRFKREESPPPSDAKCADVNVFGYALGPGAGVWEIRAENVKGDYSFEQLHDEFKKLEHHDEKVAWLQSYDATYRSQLHDGPVTDITGHYP